jgi:hypothetical protein
MKRTEHNSAARTRGELTGDRGSLRLSQAIDARRRLNTRQADRPGTKAHPLGPSDLRFAHLTNRTTRRAIRIVLNNPQRASAIAS